MVTIGNEWDEILKDEFEKLIISIIKSNDIVFIDNIDSIITLDNCLIDIVKNNVVFKSGYPTFGTNGHLSIKPNDILDDILDDVYIGYKPTDTIKSGLAINYLA